MPDFSNLEPRPTANRPQPRMSKRVPLPASVKARNMAGFIFGTVGSDAATSMGNGSEVYVTFSISQNQEFEIIGHPYISIYVGTVAVANLLPGGARIDE